MAVRDPAYAIQAGIFAALTGSTDMIAAFGAAPRIYDTVPIDPSGSIDTGLFPYCTIGDDQIIGATNQSSDVTETWAKIEVWSRPQAAADNGEVKTIAGAVRAALDAPITLIGHRVITHAFHGAIYRREPDGLTRRAIVTIQYRTQPTPPSPSDF